MSLSAAQAADQVGMTKQGLIKAIRTGKVSAQKDVHGQWSIEPVELFRVYPAVNGNGNHVVDSVDSVVHDGLPQGDLVDGEVDFGLQAENKLLREMIADLRGQLAVATEEKQQLLAVVTTLTNQAAPAKAKTGWWQRLLGG
jgi:adenylosuccinate lyase